MRVCVKLDGKLRLRLLLGGPIQCHVIEAVIDAVMAGIVI